MRCPACGRDGPFSGIRRAFVGGRRVAIRLHVGCGTWVLVADIQAMGETGRIIATT